jgi:Protein of unknown function (DUF3168)
VNTLLLDGGPLNGAAVAIARATLRRGLLAHLRADSTIAATVAGRIYFGRLPQRWQPPSLTYRVASDERGRDLDGPDGTSLARVLVECWARDQGECEDLAAAVVACLERAHDAGDLGGVPCRWAHQQQAEDQEEPEGMGSDATRCRIPVEFEISYET